MQSENLDPKMFEQLQNVDTEAMKSQLEVRGSVYCCSHADVGVACARQRLRSSCGPLKTLCGLKQH